MTIVSSNEFNTNQEKYLDLAINNQVFIQRGDNMLVVQNIGHYAESEEIFEPDDDFYRSIPMTEVQDRIVGYIQKKYAK